MGRKVHPYGFRLGVSRTWTAKWYADKEYTALLKEDIGIRQLVDRRLANASVSGVEIERGINHVTVTIHTAKPGIVIGKGGANVEVLRQQIGGLTKRRVKLEIKEIRQPELDAHLVAMNIAGQLSRRIAFKKAMKQAIQRSMKAGAKGVRIAVAGRLGGSEMGRREWYREGRVPLHTLRAKVDFGLAEAKTTFGIIGVKVWVYHGDEIPHREQETERALARAHATAQQVDNAGRGGPSSPERGVSRPAPTAPAAPAVTPAAPAPPVAPTVTPAAPSEAAQTAPAPAETVPPVETASSDAAEAPEASGATGATEGETPTPGGDA
jgi:small subunit ribosomal protein S3